MHERAHGRPNPKRSKSLSTPALVPDPKRIEGGVRAARTPTNQVTDKHTGAHDLPPGTSASGAGTSLTGTKRPRPRSRIGLNRFLSASNVARKVPIAPQTGPRGAVSHSTQSNLREPPRWSGYPLVRGSLRGRRPALVAAPLSRVVQVPAIPAVHHDRGRGRSLDIDD